MAAHWAGAASGVQSKAYTIPNADGDSRSQADALLPTSITDANRISDRQTHPDGSLVADVHPNPLR